MGELFEILISIGLVGLVFIRSNQKRAKQAQQAAKKARAFRDAAEVLDTPKAKPAPSGEGWQELLAEMESLAKAKEAKPDRSEAKPAEIKAKPAKPLVKPAEPAVKPVQKKAAPVLFLENDEPEGSISTQGESAAEHALHRERILAREEALRREHEELLEIRSMNLQKLRTAVVMSEVLGKPVSLRRRGN